MYICVLHFRATSSWTLGDDGIVRRKPEHVYVAYNGRCGGKVKLAGAKCDLPEGARARVTASDDGRGRYLVSFSLDNERWEDVRVKNGRPARFAVPMLDASESWDVIVSAYRIDVADLLGWASTKDGKLYEGVIPESGGADSYRYVDSRGWRASVERSGADAEFALRLVEATAARETGNVMLSPLSAAVVLGMLEEGAGGATRKEIRAALCGAEPDILPGSMCESGVLKKSNSLWVNGKTSRMLRERYVEEVRRRFDAEVTCMPFDERMVQALNDRVAHDTDGMIGRMLDEAPDGQLIALNCLAFSSDWEEPFKPRDVEDGTFHPRPGESQNCVMMYGYPATYLRLNGGVGITKAYAGGRFGLFCLLPPEGQSPERYLAGISGAELYDALDAPYSDRYVTYKLPQLSLECGIELNDPLRDLGIKKAFALDADFGGISVMPLYLSEVLQKTRFELDARGTRAAAATMVMYTAGGVPDFDRELSIDFDRPFVLGIEDTETHVPIFLGIVREVG